MSSEKTVSPARAIVAHVITCCIVPMALALALVEVADASPYAVAAACYSMDRHVRLAVMAETEADNEFSARRIARESREKYSREVRIAAKTGDGTMTADEIGSRVADAWLEENNLRLRAALHDLTWKRRVEDQSVSYSIRSRLADDIGSTAAAECARNFRSYYSGSLDALETMIVETRAAAAREYAIKARDQEKRREERRAKCGSTPAELRACAE